MRHLILDNLDQLDDLFGLHRGAGRGASRVSGRGGDASLPKAFLELSESEGRNGLEPAR